MRREEPGTPLGPVPARSRAAVVVLVLAAAAVGAGQAVAVTWGLVGGPVWADRALELVDGQPSDGVPVLVAGVVLVLLGLWWVAGAVLPRRRTHVADRRPGDAAASLWWAPQALAVLASRYADRQPGVLSARVRRSSRRRLVLEVEPHGAAAPEPQELGRALEGVLPDVPTRAVVKAARARREEVSA